MKPTPEHAAVSSPPNDYRYWAFISYSHDDERWGTWLHKALETYRVPRKLVGRQGPNGVVPRRILPVFRDRDELASASSLSEKVETALRQSRYLVVICSPKAAVSRWVDEEVRRFKALGREDRVLCLIVEGEPNASDDPDSGELESLPNAVRHRVSPRGRITSRRAEPLAADVRKGRDSKTNAKLRLLAAILAVDYDELRKREARRRRLRWMQLATAGAMISAVVAGVWHNRQQIAKQQERLATSHRLAAHALDVIEVNLDLALLLSVEAYRISSTPQAKKSLLAALSYNPRLEAFLKLHSDGVASVAFSPAGDLMASAGADGTIILWDTARKAPVGRLTGHKDALHSVAFSPDAKTLASAGADSTIILWDVDRRAPLGSPLRGHKDAVHSVAFTPDGAVLLSAAYDSTVMLWSLANQQPLAAPVRGHGAPITRLAVSPDGERFVTGGGFGVPIVVWDLGTREPIGRLRWSGDSSATGRTDDSGGPKAEVDATNYVNDVAFSPNGELLAAGYRNGNVVVWEMTSLRQREPPLRGHKGWVFDVEFHPNGRLLASAGMDGAIALWSISLSRELERLPSGHDDAPWSLAFSPDGSRLIAGMSHGFVALWELAAPQPQGRRALRGHEGPVHAVAMDPAGGVVASGGRDGVVVLWDVARSQVVSRLPGHRGSVWSIAISPDGGILASAGGDSTIRLWDMSTRTPIGSPLRGEAEAYSLDFSPDGSMLASGWGNGAVAFWSMNHRAALSSPLVAHSGSVHALDFSPDGKTLVSGGDDNKILFWDPATLKPVGEPLMGHPEIGRLRDGIASVKFSPDKQLLASGSFDFSIVLWDVVSRTPLGEPLVTGLGWVNALSFSPDGGTLAAPGESGAIVLWDVVARQSLGQLTRGHAPGVLNVASISSLVFSYDGRTLVSGGADGAVVVWDVAIDSWLSRACAAANRNLTGNEWSQFLGDRPYRATCLH